MSIMRVTAPTLSFVCSVDKHEMARQRGLHGDLRRLLLAYLADHDDVGILAQHVLQHLGEREPDVGPHLVLIDEVELILHRVLDRHDVLLEIVQVIDRGVEARGLAAARGPGDENQAVVVRRAAP